MKWFGIVLVACGGAPIDPPETPDPPALAHHITTFVPMPPAAMHWGVLDDVHVYWAPNGARQLAAGISEVSFEWLWKRVPADAPLLDAVVAVMAEQRNFGDANATLDRLDEIDPNPPVDVGCERAVNRAAVLNAEGDIMALSRARSVLSRGGPDACLRRASAVYCDAMLVPGLIVDRRLSIARLVGYCHTYVGFNPDARLEMTLAVRAWPTELEGRQRDDRWLDEAELASSALPLPDAMALTAAALENYVRANDCQNLERERVRELLRKLPANKAITTAVNLDLRRTQCVLLFERGNHQPNQVGRHPT